MIESEKKIETRLREGVTKMGGLCLKLITMHFLGLPDRLVLLPGGIIFFAELKTTNKKPEPIQGLVHRKLRRLGFKVYVIDSIALVKQTLAKYE